jgi:hypothetical protein
MALNKQHEWIRWPILVDKYELVHIVSLKLTSPKCCEDSKNGKNSFNFNLTNRDSQNLSCKVQPILESFALASATMSKHMNKFLH